MEEAEVEEMMDCELPALQQDQPISVDEPTMDFSVSVPSIVRGVADLHF